MSHTWAAAVLKLKVDPAIEPRVLAYGRSLHRLRAAHAARLKRADGGNPAAFPMTPVQLVRLVHFTPLLPPQARYLNLATFLAKPAASDFGFLAPLVQCDKPSAAKAAFFGGLAKLKAAVAAAAAPAVLTEAASASLVDTILEVMDGAAVAGSEKFSAKL